MPGRPQRIVALGALVVVSAITIAVIVRGLQRAAGAETTAASAAPRPAHPRPSSITLNWVGDIALSSERGLPPGGVAGALAPVENLLRDADLSVGNLEGTLSVGGASKCGGITVFGCYAFQAPPSVAGDLRAAGFGLVNQANNHSLDYGESGRQQTLAALRQYGLPYTGLPGQITAVSIRGIRVAFVGFAPYRYVANLLDIPAAQAMVRQARLRTSMVVVIMHDGAEGASAAHTPPGVEYFMGEDRGDTRAFAHAVIDAGAAVVLGSGPHVVRGVEDYRGHLIAYSVGNFLGYHTLGGGGLRSQSAILHLTLSSRGRLLRAQWRSLVLEDGRPRPDPTGASAAEAASLSAQDFPADHFVIEPDGGLRF